MPNDMKQPARVLAQLAIVVSIAICGTVPAQAGGGPEGVLLVVNPRSPDSLTIANHFARLRAIPPDNLFYLPWDPNLQTADVETFRQRILKPVIATIEKRRLADQIDSIVYSSDFPWGIDVKRDVRKHAPQARPTEPASEGQQDAGGGAAADAQAKMQATLQKVLTPVGSLNGLTYLWRWVLTQESDYRDLNANFYMPPLAPWQRDVPSAGFRGNRRYNAHGEEAAAVGRRYFLSTMLAVTAGRGNSTAEAIDYLKRSAAADGTHPKGTIYLTKNTDVRSEARHEWFPAVAEALKKLGVAAEVIEGTVPLGRSDVQGVVMGTPTFDWKASGSTILPGAVCENFTSLGGVMRVGGGQTPLSVFLRYGAAGSSGTVYEPYSIANKFPSPWIQVHYARGCTLAEAFYRSVRGPYQLLIVGDPLCQPWADIPQVSAIGVERNAVVRGIARLKPAARVASGKPIDRFWLFVDGRRVAECPPGGSLEYDTTRAADGHHELRVVAVGPKPIESQGRLLIPVRFENHGRKIEASTATKGPVKSDAVVMVDVRSPDSVGVVVAQGSRIVGRTAGQQGRIEIPAKTLGTGPVLLRVVGLGDGDARTNVVAEPIEFVIQ